MARDDGEQQAMTSERLMELKSFVSLVQRMIEEEWTVTGTFGDDGIIQAQKDAEAIGAVLAEVERLRTREAAQVAEREQAMEIVRAVANQDCAQDIDDPEWMQCLACGGGGPTGDSIEHHEICYYVKARALLASAGESERSVGDGA